MDNLVYIFISFIASVVICWVIFGKITPTDEHKEAVDFRNTPNPN